MDAVGGSAGSGVPERQRFGRRRRRPSGEPPPLPRELGRSGITWIALAVTAIAVCGLTIAYTQVGGAFERWDTSVLRGIERLRSGWLTVFMKDLDVFLSSAWTIRIARWGTIAILISVRRWRHLLVFVASVVAVELITYQVGLLLARPRPLDITILATWHGPSMPSRPVASLAVTLVGIVYAVLPPGQIRSAGKWAAGAGIIVLGLARLYLGADHPTDVLVGAVLGVTVPLAAFRWFTPNEVFPVTYAGGRAAHLDVTGRRADAIRAGLEQQIGLTVLEIRPIGLEGSGGSTPLRLRLAGTEGAPERYVFAKLYAKSHVRADRWYKLGRTILYGALEDETPFGSVRRFVEYEHYALLFLRSVGVPAPEPFGVVEITPEREYLIVMEFFEDALEIGDAEVDDSVIYDGLRLIRRCWDAGLAHRDIKPANLMVRDGKVLVIDVFFVQVRPSPWRQAVDLANMMLILALRSDAERVYRAALRSFSEDEIGEAFAAARGAAIPTQLRSALKEDGRDLTAAFRGMAPPHRPISIQLWGLRRVALAALVLALTTLAVAILINYWEILG
jgi:membrane-associated phospholipid phosphatase/tRNA A-37 threonylcarbamoyl transferase component Bud32